MRCIIKVSRSKKPAKITLFITAQNTEDEINLKEIYKALDNGPGKDTVLSVSSVKHGCRDLRLEFKETK